MGYICSLQLLYANAALFHVATIVPITDSSQQGLILMNHGFQTKSSNITIANTTKGYHCYTICWM